MDTLEVDDMNIGSEISDFVTDFLRPASMARLLLLGWNPWGVEAVDQESMGDCATRDGVELTENGVIGDGLGDMPISNASPVCRACILWGSK